MFIVRMQAAGSWSNDEWLQVKNICNLY